MNHIVTRVLLAFPNAQSDFPSVLLPAQGSGPLKRPCHLGLSFPKLHHTHIQRQTPNTHAPTFGPRTSSCRACTEPWDLTQFLAV